MEPGSEPLQYLLYFYSIVNAHQIKRVLLVAYLQILYYGRILLYSYKPALYVEIPADEEHKKYEYIDEEPHKSIESPFQYE